jgi:hypothetical protein
MSNQHPDRAPHYATTNATLAAASAAVKIQTPRANVEVGPPLHGVEAIS